MKNKTGSIFIMPKPIINFKEAKLNDIALNVDVGQNKSFETTELVFRRRRSQGYINKLKKLDIADHKISKEKINEIINAVKNELPEISVDELPIGIVAKCYLGEPYEVHTLSLVGETIIKHYKNYEPLPEILEKARKIANNEKYEFVEVYHSKMIVVKEDGTTAIIEDTKK